MKRYINILMVALMMTSSCTEDPRDQLYEEEHLQINANKYIYINAVAVSTITLVAVQTVRGLGTCHWDL